LQTLVGSMIGRQSGPDRAIHSTPLYQPLDFDLHEIRVLLVAWDEEEDTPIICSMEHISLINPKPYITLSYCWGNPDITNSMWIRDSRTSYIHQLTVTNNLTLALRSLRKHLKDGSVHLSPSSPLLVWVDAICL
jgi:hypothetical protein